MKGGVELFAQAEMSRRILRRCSSLLSRAAPAIFGLHGRYGTAAARRLSLPLLALLLLLLVLLA